MEAMKIDEEQLCEILRRNSGARLFCTAEKIRENAKKEYFADEFRRLFEIADASLGNTTPTADFEAYYNVEETGFSDEYLWYMIEKRRKINALLIVYIVTEEERYLVSLQNEIWVLCNEYAWAAPSEMRGHSHTKDGWEGIAHHQHLDLISTENAFMLAEILHLIGERLAPVTVHRMETEIWRRALCHYADNAVRFWWEDCDNNWAAVCGGSVACAAIYMMKDEKQLAHTLVRAMQTLDKFIGGYGADGASVEGVSYWGYGFSNFAFFAELLKQRTKGEIDLLADEHCRQIARFAQRSRIYGKLVMNFGDCAPEMTLRTGLMHRLKGIYPEIILPEQELMMKYGDDHCYRFAGFIRDYAWYDDKLCADGDLLDEGSWFLEPQIFTSRKNDVFFAAVGGNNGYNHNHNDIGHFLYFIRDKGFFVDMGQGIYCSQYFGEQRYTFRPASADGHSIAQIDGCIQQPGTESAAVRVEYERADTDRLNIGLEESFRCDKLERYDRSFEFFADGSLNICDKFVLSKQVQITEQFLVDSDTEPEFSDGGLTLANGGTKIYFECDKGQADFFLEC